MLLYVKLKSYIGYSPCSTVAAFSEDQTNESSTSCHVSTRINLTEDVSANESSCLPILTDEGSTISEETGECIPALLRWIHPCNSLIVNTLTLWFTSFSFEICYRHSNSTPGAVGNSKIWYDVYIFWWWEFKKKKQQWDNVLRGHQDLNLRTLMICS